MKKITLILCFVSLACSAQAARAQGTTRTPDVSVLRDAEMERDSMKSLIAVRHYFKLKKAYVGALDRCKEIIEGNPNFTRLDEVLYYAGASSFYLSENRGKQAPKLSAEKYRQDAREYLARVVSEFPESEFRKLAEKELSNLDGTKPKN